MEDFFTISWTSFWLIVALQIIFVIMFKRSHFPYILNKSQEGWLERNLIIILVLITVISFLLVHPITHGIEIVTLLLIYKFLFEPKLTDSQKPLSSVLKNKTSEKQSLTLECWPEPDLSMLESRKNLERCIFSAAYLSVSDKNYMHFDGNSYRLSVILQSPKYINSLRQYISDSGFKVSITNNNI